MVGTVNRQDGFWLFESLVFLICFHSVITYLAVDMLGMPCLVGWSIPLCNQERSHRETVVVPSFDGSVTALQVYILLRFMSILPVSFAFGEINTVKLTDDLRLLFWNKRSEPVLKATIANKTVNVLINRKISHRDTGTLRPNVGHFKHTASLSLILGLYPRFVEPGRARPAEFSLTAAQSPS